MRAIIIEDEYSAAANLKILLRGIEPTIEILGNIETVAEAIEYFKSNEDYDLVFMDIHLADGSSFEIVNEVEPSAPIIFTTAYDNYAIQAFKLNSIDYLLKPIREKELRNAIHKFKENRRNSIITSDQIETLIRSMNLSKKEYRKSFLIQKRDSFIPIQTNEVAYFYIKDGVVRGSTIDNTTFSINEKLEDLEQSLDPTIFFRVNRQYLIQRPAIKSLENYFNGRLVVHIFPESKERIIVSKANASRLKAWLNDVK